MSHEMMGEATLCKLCYATLSGRNVCVLFMNCISYFVITMTVTAWPNGHKPLTSTISRIKHVNCTRCIQIKQPWTNLDTNHLAVHKLEHKSLHALYYSTFSNNYRCRYGSINYCGYAHPQQGKWSQPKELHRRPQLQCSDQLQSVRNVLHPQSHLWQQHPGPAGGVLGRILWGVQPLLLYPPPAIPLSYAPPLLYPLSPSSLYPLISMPLPFSIPISLCPPCTLWPISVVHDIYYLLPIAETVQQ